MEEKIPEIVALALNSISGPSEKAPEGRLGHQLE